MSHSSLCGKTNCLTTPHELTNFHILESSLKQFEALGKSVFKKRSDLENLFSGGYSGCQVTGRIEGFFWIFYSGQVFFFWGGGGVAWFLAGIQNNLTIRGSARIASATNNVQPSKIKHVILSGNFSDSWFGIEFFGGQSLVRGFFAFYWRNHGDVFWVLCPHSIILDS